MSAEPTPQSQDTMQPFRVAGCLVDPAACLLDRAGDQIHIEPKVMQVLTCLASRRGKVVTRRELEDSVWTETVVGYKAVTNAVIKLRKALGDDPRNPRIIQTIPKRGYRLVADIAPATPESERGTNATDGDAPAAALRASMRPAAWLVVLVVAAVGALAWWQPWGYRTEPTSTRALPNEPSIAVLPFENLSSDPEQDYLANGIAESLITALTNVDVLFVIARDSAFVYKENATSPETAAEELGVRYILKGSVQGTGKRMRISAQLIDVPADRHLWAQTYEHEEEDIFTVLDEVTLNIVSALQVELTEGEHARLRRATTNDLEAWLHFERGLRIYRRYTKEDLMEAERLWTTAAELDPDWPMPRVGLAWIPVTEYQFGWSDEPAKALEKAAVRAKQALMLDEKFPDTYALLSRINTLQGEFEKAAALGEKSLELSPNNPMNMVIVASNMTRAGRPDVSVELMTKAMRRNPFYPRWYTIVLIRAYVLLGQYDEMIPLAAEFVNDGSGSAEREALVHLIFAYAELGREDQSKAQVARLLEIDPGYSLRKQKETTLRQYQDDVFWERYYKVLHDMGLP